MAHTIEWDNVGHHDFSARLEMAAPWLVSLVFHLGIGLLVLFLAWFIVSTTRSAMSTTPIVMPATFDPHLPGGVAHVGDQNTDRDPRQNIRNMLLSGAWSHAGNQSALLSPAPGLTGDFAVDLILPGTSGATGTGHNTGLDTGGTMAPYGAPNGGYGNGGTLWKVPTGGAVRIVYIIDHSGSLLDNFDFLRAEVKRSLEGLAPIQQFAVIAFSEDAEILGPPVLQRATPLVRRDLDKRLDDIRAQGQNDGELLPFQHAFEKAFALKPQLIYFLTDGAFDPKLSDVIRHLNVGHRVRINTLALVHADPEYENQLKDLARENGGIYKFISEKDLGN